MKEQLKNFFLKNFQQDKETQKPTSIKSSDFDSELSIITYEEWGFEQAQKQNGNKMAFIGSMNLVKQEYKRRELRKQEKTHENINKAKEELSRLETQIGEKKSTVESITDKIQTFKDKINTLQKEIIRIKENPQEILKDRMSKAGFLIGLFILSFLTVYLFIFYSSASYSGFFKKFTGGDSVGSSIFDPQAIAKAYKYGLTVLVLILTIPFIFLGLGYLIHKFQEGKGPEKYIKIGAMILITFGFDALLAYKIEKELYEVKRMMDATGALPPHKLSMALDSENFWLVIFAGFIAYIIWGFIFDFVMDSYDKLDVVKQAITARETEIKINQGDIDKCQEEKEKAEAEIIRLEGDCKKQQAIISGNTIIIDWGIFGNALLEFSNGWANWMTHNKKTKDQIDEIWQEQEKFLNQHQNEINNKNN
ncbi:coiled-coil domain-containing protein [Riemerella columbipharyngis]|uniref:Uncharacterized protein n=1 Tax=Riemerella columbipharyngis TaxID=1071918 RepID=A0A1G7BAZ9_9FLAO|nr:hypothetical protein [Riemerella columbipharyngis]SDE24191.1 hypothetical protein SAMN05421544_10596 [Riemerella columbipharyngis]